MDYIGNAKDLNIRSNHRNYKYFLDDNGRVWLPDLSNYMINNDGLQSASFLQREDNSVFKLYDRSIQDKYRISYDVFETLKAIDNSHLVKLLERFYQYEDLAISFPNWKDVRSLDISGYTSEYVESDRVKILKNRSDYLLDNVAEMQKLFDLLSCRWIHTSFDYYIDDLVKAGSSGLIITNPDLFSLQNRYSTNWESLRHYNREQMLSVITSLALREYSSFFFHSDAVGVKGAIDGLFCGLSYEDDMAFELEKRLGRARRPIDYIRNKRR